jgi:methyltransferase (TIGR00027 family)
VNQRPSTTALAVAFGQLLDAHDPELAPLIDAEQRALLEACVAAFVPRGPRGLRMLQRPWYRRMMWMVESMTARGIFLHYLMRKRFIEDAVRAAMADGCTQLAVIGAGLDTLATRLAREQPSLRCIEIDHPSTQEVKRAGVADGRPDNLALIGLDLRDRPLDEALRTSSVFDGDAQTVFVAEGLLMYLTGEQAAELFRELRSVGGDGSRVVFTFMESSRPDRVRFKGIPRWYAPLLDFWLARLGEPMQWAIQREALAGWLAPLGWSLLDIGTRESFRALYLKPHGLEDRALIDGEYVGVAE